MWCSNVSEKRKISNLVIQQSSYLTVVATENHPVSSLFRQTQHSYNVAVINCAKHRCHAHSLDISSHTRNANVSNGKEPLGEELRQLYYRCHGHMSSLWWISYSRSTGPKFTLYQMVKKSLDRAFPETDFGTEAFKTTMNLCAFKA